MWDLGDAVTSPASGVAVAPDGTVIVVDRDERPFAWSEPVDHDVVHRVDPDSGRVVGSWGRGALASPHGVDVASDGTVWITDVGSNQVVAFDAYGEETFRLGSPYGSALEKCMQVRNVLTNLPCPSEGLTFARPTDVVAADDGSVYISDGYRGSRVVKVDADGHQVAAIGELGDAPGQFFLPHGIDLLADGRVVVAERRNARVQLVDADLSRATVVPARLGRPYDVAVGPDGDLYVLDGGDGLDGGGQSRSAVYRLDPDTYELLHAYRMPTGVAGHQLAVSDEAIVVTAIEGAPTWHVSLDGA